MERTFSAPNTTPSATWSGLPRPGDRAAPRPTGARRCVSRDVWFAAGRAVPHRPGHRRAAKRWLPGFCAGEIVTAIAMTEPGTGSDLRGIRTRVTRDGSGRTDWVLNGRRRSSPTASWRSRPGGGRTGAEAARTRSAAGRERDCPAFERGRNLDKMGMHAQDTAELRSPTSGSARTVARSARASAT